MKAYLSTPPTLYAIVSIDKGTDFRDLSSKVLEAKIEWIQVRNKGVISNSEFKKFAKELKQLRDKQCPLSKIIINDNALLAKEIGADGVHLGQSDMDPVLAREILGENAIIGLSTNNLSQALSAPIEVLSYLACGPVFHSNSKSGHAEPLGLEGVKNITSNIDFPFVAIGGVNLGNAGAVFEAGAKSVAMIGELINHRNTLYEFKQKIKALLP